MNHIIIRETSAEIRAIARGALKNNWPLVTFVMGLFYLFTIAVPRLLAVLMPSASYSVYHEALQEYVTISYASSLYDFVLTGAFAVGLCSFFLAFFRRRELNPGHIFNGFEVFFKAFGLMIVQGVLILLWSMLFIIPGFIAALRYSQSFYILADSPQKGIMQCIRESKAVMTGNKAKFFCLGLSYFGWIFLGILPLVFLPLTDGVFGVVLEMLYLIPYYAVLAYMETAMTAFYELATGHLAVRAPQPGDSGYRF